MAGAGCDVALDGHDGDGVLGLLYSWVANTLLDGRPDRLARAVRDVGSRSIARQLAVELVPPAVWRLARRSPAPPDYRVALVPYFVGDTRRAMMQESRWRPPRAGWRAAQLGALTAPRTQLFEEIELLGARAGIDVRHPFADRELVVFAAALPHAVKASSALAKPLLRDALADLLPETVATRVDKTYFEALVDVRVDYEACYWSVRDSGVRLPEIDYDRLFADAARPVNDRAFWIRLTRAHLFAAGVRP